MVAPEAVCPRPQFQLCCKPRCMVLAFREIQEWKFVKPIFIGDTIHAVLTVTETKALPRIGGGALISTVEVRNQSNDVLQKGTLNLLVMSKPK